MYIYLSRKSGPSTHAAKKNTDVISRYSQEKNFEPLVSDQESF